jgi:ABC-type antimicrobial peptide transport system permease subunit
MLLLHTLRNTVRFIRRNGGFSTINIVGLTLGIFSCLLIILYIHSEYSFDKFRHKGDNIYRVVMHQPGNQVTGSSTDWWVVSPAILKPTWESELPEVDLVTRTTPRHWTFKHRDQYIDETILIVDPEFLEIFTFPLKAGNQANAMKDPYSIIVTQKMADKYFGDIDPMGETLVKNDGKQFTVTGILEEIPNNSHLKFDFLDVYNIEIKDGRNFSRHMGTDDGHAYILNNAAVERLGFQSPVRAKFGFDGQLGTVVGVTNDFYFESLHKPITPLGIGVKDNFICQFISIKIRNNNIPKILDHIEDAWKNFIPATPLDFSFFDERLERLYGKERQLTKSMNYLSLMALIISCLGIFGLMSFSLKERTKEIGIRKVMGASLVRLLRLILWDIVSIIGIAAVAGGILGWYISADWLKNFAYRFSLGIDVIIIASIFTFFMAMIPLSFMLVKSVSTNPVDSLRTE